MTLSVCLTLDAAAERAVRALWQRLEEAGIATLLTHTHGRHIPHLTLASLRSWDLEPVQKELSEQPLDLPQVVHFDALGSPDRPRPPAASSTNGTRDGGAISSITAGSWLDRWPRRH